MNSDQVRQKLRDILDRDLLTQAEWSARNGVSESYTSDFLAGRREPGKSILSALGLVCVKSYEPARFQPGDPSCVGAFQRAKP